MAERIDDSDLLKDIIFDEHNDYRTICEYSGDKTRWHIYTTTVFQRIADAKLFLVGWRRAATEYQEHEFGNSAFECEPYTETITKYRPIA